MKSLLIVSATVLLVLPLSAQEKSAQLKDQKDKVSYSIGVNIGTNLSRQKVSVNPDTLSAGIKDGIAGFGDDQLFLCLGVGNEGNNDSFRERYDG